MVDAEENSNDVCGSAVNAPTLLLKPLQRDATVVDKPAEADALVFVGAIPR